MPPKTKAQAQRGIKASTTIMTGIRAPAKRTVLCQMVLRTRPGRKMIAFTRSSAPPTAIPTTRNGNRRSQTIGYKTSATIASGQHSTRTMHHKRNFAMASVPQSRIRGSDLNSSNLALFRFFPGSYQLLSLPDHIRALFIWQCEHGLRSLGQPFIDQVARTAQLVLHLPWLQRVPALHGDPMRLGQVGRSANALILKQLMQALRTTVEPQHARACPVQIGHGKHFSADVAVGSPVDEVMAPVDSLHNVRERQANLANTLVVHAVSVSRRRQSENRKSS